MDSFIPGGTMRRTLIQFALLIAALLFSGCVPVSATELKPPGADLPMVKTDASMASQSTPFPDFSETATVPFPLAEPTSRGDSLVATDPVLVNLSAGIPTLVEFFRFT
jgi:hypothetical protein